MFMTCYSTLFNKHFPLVKQSRKNFKHKVWLTKALTNSIHSKNSLYKRWLTSKTVADESKYESYAKHLKTLLTKARNDYYQSLFDKATKSSKEIWKCVNSLTCSKYKISNTSKLTKIVYNNNLHTDDSSIANAFNDYFID